MQASKTPCQNLQVKALFLLASSLQIQRYFTPTSSKKGSIPSRVHSTPAAPVGTELLTHYSELLLRNAL